MYACQKEKLLLSKNIILIGLSMDIEVMHLTTATLMEEKKEPIGNFYILLE